jgi:hypothetical protein
MSAASWVGDLGWQQGMGTLEWRNDELETPGLERELVNKGMGNASSPALSLLPYQSCCQPEIFFFFFFGGYKLIYLNKIRTF